MAILVWPPRGIFFSVFSAYFTTSFSADMVWGDFIRNAYVPCGRVLMSKVALCGNPS